MKTINPAAAFPRKDSADSKVTLPVATAYFSPLDGCVVLDARRPIDKILRDSSLDAIEKRLVFFQLLTRLRVPIRRAFPTALAWTVPPSGAN